MSPATRGLSPRRGASATAPGRGCGEPGPRGWETSWGAGQGPLGSREGTFRCRGSNRSAVRREAGQRNDNRKQGDGWAASATARRTVPVAWARVAAVGGTEGDDGTWGRGGREGQEGGPGASPQPRESPLCTMAGGSHKRPHGGPQRGATGLCPQNLGEKQRAGQSQASHSLLSPSGPRPPDACGKRPATVATEGLLRAPKGKAVGTPSVSLDAQGTPPVVAGGRSR